MTRITAVLCMLLLTGHAFAADRVAVARKNQSAELTKLFSAAKVSYPPREIYLRAFKHEGELELWAGKGGKAPLAKITTFRICMSSGGLGPKRQLGDGQVPEGFYKIDRFNPTSSYHLSLGLDYPNESDRMLGRKGALGGDIFIHGSCVTIGCLPIEDDFIEQLYVIATDARAAGQREIPVHVFPRRLDEKGMAALAREGPEHLAFWKSLQPAYAQFEQTRRPPKVSVDGKTGAYIVAPGS